MNTLRKLFLVILLGLGFTTLCMANERDDLIKELEAKISLRQHYMDIKEARIDSLRQLITPKSLPEEQYFVNNEIYKEYDTYRYDSAMLYIYKNKQIADKLDKQNYKDEVKLHESMLLSTTGMFKESIDNLNSIDRKLLDESLLLSYYTALEWTYLRMKNYVNDGIYSLEYEKLEKKYSDSVFCILPKDSIMYDYYRGYMFLDGGQLEEAKDILSGMLQKLEVNTRLYAIVTSNIATIYQLQNNWAEYEKYLIRSAISDQICALKENRAMQELAIYLFKEKPDDLERAYKYIQYSMEDAQFYNNRLRTVQIAQKLPIIVSTYQAKSKRENQNLRLSLIVISVLSLCMTAAMIYIYKQMKLVKNSRHRLRDLNNKLSELNSQLTDSNKKLSEANKTKEEYVGLFIDLCSSYINKMSQYRETVKRKIMVKQIDELYEMSNSKKAIQAELSDFFENFDKAFLNLYPSFISDFNLLLSQDGQIVLKKGELLSPELRVFALIRLSITDSSKIATFLRFSPQTVYNYRAKIKSYSIVGRNDFEKHVMGIGSLAI